MRVSATQEGPASRKTSLFGVYLFSRSGQRAVFRSARFSGLFKDALRSAMGEFGLLKRFHWVGQRNRAFWRESC